MRINVRRRDGLIETLTLVPPIQICHGGILSHIRCGDGTDHYFCGPDSDSIEGDYDGWGRAVSIEMASEEDGLQKAAAEIQKVEEAREFPNPQNPGSTPSS